MSGVPRVDIVSGDYYRRDKCVVCGKTAERSKTITASTFQEVQRKAAARNGRPLAHKKCELRYLGEEELW